MKKQDVMNINVEIEGLSAPVNRTLNALARIRGVTKKVIIREALEEYAKRHVSDIKDIATRLSGGSGT